MCVCVCLCVSVCRFQLWQSIEHGVGMGIFYMCEVRTGIKTVAMEAVHCGGSMPRKSTGVCLN